MDSNLYVFKQLNESSGAVYSAPPINFYTNSIHTAVVSPTNAGKSVAVFLLYMTMARNLAYKSAKIIVLDPKNYEYAKFKKSENIYLGEQVKDGFEYFYDRFEARLEGIEPSNNLLFLVIEEYSGFILLYEKKEQEKIKAKIGRLLMMSRALNIRCIFIMQRFDSAYFINGARDNITTRISLGTISKESQKMLFPDDEIDSLPKRQGYLSIDGIKTSKIIVPTVRHFERLFNDVGEFLNRNK